MHIPSLINHNGNIVPTNTIELGIDNRAFQYGDGFFESMRTHDYTLLFDEYHQRRLDETLTYFSMQGQPIRLKDEVEKLLRANSAPRARCKLICHRSSGGMYLPNENSFQYHILLQDVEPQMFSSTAEGLSATVYYENTKSCSPLANYKSSSAQLYVLASLFGQSAKKNEVILLNQHGRVCEGCNANIYFANEKKEIFKIPLSEGCLNGVMGQVSDKTLLDAGYKLVDAPIALADLQKFNESWLCNVSRGIRHLSSIDAYVFPSTTCSEALISLLNMKYY